MDLVCGDCGGELLGSIENTLVLFEHLKSNIEKEVSSLLSMLLLVHGPSSDERGEKSPQEQTTELTNNSRDQRSDCE